MVAAAEEGAAGKTSLLLKKTVKYTPMERKYIILLYYKYLPLENPEQIRDEQKSFAQFHGLKGRVIVSNEGINGTLEGLDFEIKAYVDWMEAQDQFKGIHYKYSQGTGQALPKLSVKVRSEIVAYRLGEGEVKPWETTGKYLAAEDLHEWIHSGKKFFIVDMRNGFEQEVGHFAGSTLMNMGHSEDLPKMLSQLDHIPKNEPVVTVCTGGVRCEKASGFLIKHGFTNVYQLHGGIVTYMEKYPNEDFLGALYVFDSRLVMHFGDKTSKPREIVGKCASCGTPSENMVNCSDDFCHRHFIACKDCTKGKDTMLCPMGCRDYSKEHPEAFKNQSSGILGNF